VVTDRQTLGQAVTEVVLRSNLYGKDYGRSDRFSNPMVRDRDMLLLQETVLDCRVLDHSEIVSVNMRGVIHVHSKASKHVTDGNNLFYCCPHSHEFSGVGGGFDCPLSFAMIDNWGPTHKDNNSCDGPPSQLVMSMVRIDNGGDGQFLHKRHGEVAVDLFNGIRIFLTK